ncbi:MAG: hypothetical protein BWZ04_02769 [Firmicutes bacterium ADurb.BinA205]|nr:MAG: hypothetical protein BWZ04_02769 [Firmicutes bacterium ADurb.BinA205]
MLQRKDSRTGDEEDKSDVKAYECDYRPEPHSIIVYGSLCVNVTENVIAAVFGVGIDVCITDFLVFFTFYLFYRIFLFFVSGFIVADERIDRGKTLVCRTVGDDYYSVIYVLCAEIDKAVNTFIRL